MRSHCPRHRSECHHEPNRIPKWILADAGVPVGHIASGALAPHSGESPAVGSTVKIETNERGQLVLSPHKRIHSICQAQVTDQLAETIDQPGIRSVELAIGTSKGVKGGDVAWMSSERFATLDEDAEPTPIAPGLCVDVRSSSNTDEEMEEKRRLYFEAGAKEVWIVGAAGAVAFHGDEGPAKRSALAPMFPNALPDPA